MLHLMPRSDWAAGMREGFANWADTASDYASQSADLVNNSMSGLVGNISEALAGNKVDWEDWSKSVLASMQKIILNAMIVNSLQSSMGGGGFLGGLFGGSAGGSTPSGSYNSAASGLQLNAKGALTLPPASALTVTALSDHRHTLLLRKALG
jgi:lambda family phage tail tape measure protein